MSPSFTSRRVSCPVSVAASTGALDRTPLRVAREKLKGGPDAQRHAVSVDRATLIYA